MLLQINLAALFKNVTILAICFNYAIYSKFILKIHTGFVGVGATLIHIVKLIS